MKGCVICDAKNNSFYVNSEEVYLCPKHRKALEEEDLDFAREFKKNRFVVEGNVAKMSLYNKEYKEKPYKVLVDTEDIPLLENIRWTEDGYGHVITYVKKGNRIFTLKLMDYIMYIRRGITSPLYHPNCNNLDCRKSNIRIKKDMRKHKSTVKCII
jgi:hypothetical protein